MRFEYFEGTNKKWYWRLRADNGRVVADGSQGYTYRRGCREAIRRIAGAVFYANIRLVKR